MVEENGDDDNNQMGVDENGGNDNEVLPRELNPDEIDNLMNITRDNNGNIIRE